MLLTISRKLVKLSALAIALTFVGCEPAKKQVAGPDKSASDHAHDHAHAETLDGAVKELEGICATIKAAFAKDDAEAAHEPLHEVGHILEEIPDLAAKSTVDAAGKEEIKKAVESLFGAFGAVDEGMHGSGGKKYSEVAEAIDAALKVLIEKSKS